MPSLDTMDGFGALHLAQRSRAVPTWHARPYPLQRQRADQPQSVRPRYDVMSYRELVSAGLRTIDVMRDPQTGIHDHYPLVIDVVRRPAPARDVK